MSKSGSSRNKGFTTGVRLTQDQKAAIQRAADREESSISDYIRRIVLPVARGRARLFFEETGRAA